MKITFINPNLYSGYPRPPLGLLSIATVCKVVGYDVRIIDANALNLSPEQVVSKATDCDVIGLTAMTPSYGEVMKIADMFRDKFTILGGVHASVFPTECADTGLFDAVVQGEGENIIHRVLKNIENYQDKYPVGVVYQNYNLVDINQIPLPDYSLLDLSLYDARFPHAVRRPWTTASTSRGCPYSCEFCYKGVSGSKFHGMDALRMLKLVQSLNIKDITFYDDIFTFNRERLTSFCRLLIEGKVDITWTCESRVNLAKARELNLMAKAGCRLIYYGIESGSQKILNSLCKGQTLDQIRLAIKLTKDAGIMSAGYFMLGCPGETKATIQETIAFSKEIGLDHAQFSVCSPLPGSALYQKYLKTGLPIPDWSNFRYLGGKDKPMFTSDELNRDDIENAVKEANEYWTERVN